MDSDLLKNLELKIFNKLCASFFDQMGFRASKVLNSNDPSTSDISILYSKNNEKPFSIFQCSVSPESTAAEPVKKFKAAMLGADLKNGYFLTTTEFSEIAKDFAKENTINLIDGEKLIELINNMPETSQNLLFEIAMTKGDATEIHKTDTRLCPKCKTKMTLKVSSEGKYKTGKYWQCPSLGCGHISAFI
jgi:restriction system protein